MKCTHPVALAVDPIKSPKDPERTIEIARCTLCGETIDRQGKPVGEILTFNELAKRAEEQRLSKEAQREGGYGDAEIARARSSRAEDAGQDPARRAPRRPRIRGQPD